MAASEGQAKAPWFAAAIARACKSPEIRAYAEYFITAAAAYVFMTDLIKAAYVHAGDPLVFTYPRHPASAVIQPDASLIVDGTPFDTLSGRRSIARRPNQRLGLLGGRRVNGQPSPDSGPAGAAPCDQDPAGQLATGLAAEVTSSAQHRRTASAVRAPDTGSTSDGVMATTPPTSWVTYRRRLPGMDTLARTEGPWANPQRPSQPGQTSRSSTSGMWSLTASQSSGRPISKARTRGSQSRGTNAWSTKYGLSR